jgi:hypothetical protein
MIRLMRPGAPLLILGAALATSAVTIGPRIVPAHAQGVADGKVVTIRLTTAARVFDMSPTGSTAPPGWMAPTFDDSSWDHAVVAKQTCLPFKVVNRAIEPNSAVWGPHNAGRYLLRQTFMVPKASAL